MRIERVLVPILILQALSVFLLWTLNSVSSAGQDVFTLFLAVDLLGFVLVIQFYRSAAWSSVQGKAWIVALGLAMIAILVSSLFVS